MALLLAIFALAPCVVHTARRQLKAEDLEVKVVERLKILSFNLEGRGGNMADGREVRAKLSDYFVQLCSVPERPEVIITQEDVGATLPGECYTEVNSCASERFWFTNEYRFGDAAKKAFQAEIGKAMAGKGKGLLTARAAQNGAMGARMQNKIYIRTDLVLARRIVTKKIWRVDLVDADLLLEENDAGEVTKPGLNPRCAALARLDIDGQSFTVGSFHLSGGYVDDEQAIATSNKKHERSKFENIRQQQLRKILQSTVQERGGSQVIIGGDTNGFPSDQAQPCQDGRISFIKSEGKFVEPGAEASFLKYVTTPDVIGDLRQSDQMIAMRVDETVALNDQQSSVQSKGRGAEVCSSWKGSTTVWGGQPDQFFTNANAQNAQAHVLPIGLADTATHKPRFGKTLSDHNPVLFSCDLTARQNARRPAAKPVRK